WLGYKNSATGSDFAAPKRNADAYLKVLKAANDSVDNDVIAALAAEPRNKSRGAGGATVWDRAKRYVELRDRFESDGQDAAAFINNFFDAKWWISNEYEEEKVAGARLDLQILRDNALALLPGDASAESEKALKRVAQRLRHQIATNEPLATGAPYDLLVATLWGAKGMTAEHVYILGACQEALPGERREEYPGTDIEYFDEQRRLFYVSITRAKKTLVISRALSVGRGEASRLGLTVTSGGKYRADLHMSEFLHDISGLLPAAVTGDSWRGCEMV
ncbi:MAG: 3'-5' exonuclease, partial [Gemmatimonadota bacterium]